MPARLSVVASLGAPKRPAHIPTTEAKSASAGRL
jgi:hypothetical protein